MLRNKPQTKRRWLDLAPGDPVIVTTSPTAASSALSLSLASPIPMFTTTLAILGTPMTLSYSNSLVSCGTTFSR